MSKLRLYGDTSGYLDVKAPDTADNSTLDLSTVVKQDASGNVGIGTSSPSQALHVKTIADESKYLLVQNDSTSMYAGVSSTGVATVQTDDELTFNTGGYIERMRIDASGRVTMPYQPSFLAWASPSRAGSSYVYNFGLIQHNVGNHYNNATGTFNAPVDGRYFFEASIWATSGSNNYMAFYVNDNEFTGSHIDADNVATGCSSSVILDLNANDYVNLKVLFDIQGSTPRNHWSGMLIG